MGQEVLGSGPISSRVQMGYLQLIDSSSHPELSDVYKMPWNSTGPLSSSTGPCCPNNRLAVALDMKIPGVSRSEAGRQNIFRAVS
jgi:hypothetical protein